ncbi:hypothetical protein BHU61_00250 [Macrococcus epidermidis]|uniref:Uncharacterized protein n=1 Tax=Macrococcus epidermidis TaxID=1902580 RepID=A0A327ZUN0_9STAP|nr:hypothetical protein [Macrococcus epidermidis]RAK45909.1 hypothetical protein BHU61_00250 [Macrococcus epidermidis]
MKKLITTFVLSSFVVSGISVQEVKAAEINWFSKSVSSKVKAGTFAPNGMKIGQKFSAYDGKKNYFINKEAGIISTEGSQAYAYFQMNKPLNSKKISVIRNQVWKNSSKNSIRKYYGKPLLTVKNLKADDGYAYAEFYKNYALVYFRNIEWKSYKLVEIHILNNPNKDVTKKWAKIYKEYRPYLNNTNAVK